MAMRTISSARQELPSWDGADTRSSLKADRGRARKKV